MRKWILLTAPEDKMAGAKVKFFCFMLIFVGENKGCFKEKLKILDLSVGTLYSINQHFTFQIVGHSVKAWTTTECNI